jgi:predicted nucleic acid-binding protein
VPEVICDVSPVQYLHQAGLLDILPLRYGAITIPAAVADELREGRLRGVDLPAFESLDWMRIRQPAGRLLLPIITDLGAGEREVLALGTETPDSRVILDDALARRYARLLNLTLTGTLGVVLKAKETGLLPAVAPVLDRLQKLRFRMDPETRLAVLRLAGEAQSG